MRNILSWPEHHERWCRWGDPCRQCWQGNNHAESVTGVIYFIAFLAAVIIVAASFAH